MRGPISTNPCQQLYWSDFLILELSVVQSGISLRFWFASPMMLSIFSHAYWAVLGRFSRVWLFTTLWTVACQAPLSVRFSRQEYWSRLPFPSPGDLPHLGTELTSLKSALTGGLFTTSAPWENPHAYWPPAYSLWRNVYSKSLPVF